VTVVLAVRCSDGLVIGADSQITESDRGLSYPASKLHAMGDGAAWGGSGARSVLLDLETELSSSAEEILESDDVGKALQQRMLPILNHHYEHFIPQIPGEDEAQTPSAYLLAAGYNDDEPWIVEVNPWGMVSRYEDVGFHAIGSGAPMAQQAGSLLAHFRMIHRPIEYGVVGMVRVLEALKMTSPSVGGPLDVYMVRPDGIEHLGDDDLDEWREHVSRWEDIEQRGLDELFD
jgi:proteasome beta subunit